MSLDGPPLHPDAATARSLLRRELADPVYRAAEPSWSRRVLDWVGHEVSRVLDQAARTSGRGWLVALVLLALVVAVLVAIRVGPVRRGASRARLPVFDDVVPSAATARAAADAAAARRDWTAAVRERFRAVVRGLEERGVLDERPGRTADEAALDAGRAMPALVERLLAAATRFDEVCYGGRPATADDDAALRDLDAATRAARPARVA